MAYVGAGQFKRQKLMVPKGDVRPTRRHLRLSIFSFLAEFITNAAILDLFAGTGAFGIEAISMGARKAIFVDISSKAVEAIKYNLEALGIREKGVVYQSDAMDFLVQSIKRLRTFDIVFIDPPFTKLRAMKKEEYESYMLEMIDRSRMLLKPRSLVIVKYPKRLTLVIPKDLTIAQQRDYGLNRLAFLVQTEYIIPEETAHDTGTSPS